MNAFLAGHRIISVQKEFFAQECCWCFLIEYADESFGTKSSSKTDYMKVLSQEEFAVFSRLRELRKRIAAKEQIPAYAVFTDEQLSQLVKTKPQNLSQMQKISGIGSSKAEKYGEAFLKALGSKEEEEKEQNEPDIF